MKSSYKKIVRILLHSSRLRITKDVNIKYEEKISLKLMVYFIGCLLFSNYICISTNLYWTKQFISLLVLKNNLLYYSLLKVERRHTYFYRHFYQPLICDSRTVVSTM